MTCLNMTDLELHYEMERLESQIDHKEIEGAELDAEIDFYEAKLSAMREARAGGWAFMRANWLASPMSKRPIQIDLEAATELPAADFSSLAPIEASGPVSSTGPGVSPLIEQAPVGVPFPESGADAGAVQPTPPATASAPPGVQTGITYSRDGLAVAIIDGENPFFPGEDVSL